MGVTEVDTVGQVMAKKEGGQSLRGKAKPRFHLHSQLRKTKICNFHLRGACQFGDECAFAHTSTELQPTPDLSKTQLCAAFASGGCTQEDCSYAHGEEELRAASVPFKNTMCLWNRKGKCRKGEMCLFAHSADELCSEAVPSKKGMSGKEHNFFKYAEPMKVEPNGIFMRAPRAHVPNVPNVPAVKASLRTPPGPPGLPPRSAGDHGELARGMKKGSQMDSKSAPDWEGKLLHEDIQHIQNQIAALSMSLLAASARARTGAAKNGDQHNPQTNGQRQHDAYPAVAAYGQGSREASYLHRQAME
mmetsp:Transcript_54329/g.117580  ORF Transcript_54329/g.117580 Transcript_54329/m.117580 type:complete len:303 (+) Transcript_54329:112-1020(+)